MDEDRQTPSELKPDQLYRRCDPARFDFENTRELERPSEAIGLERAVEAIGFGLEIKRDGYNIYALGPAGLGKHRLIQRFVEAKTRQTEAPSDWCYVNNFHDPQKPIALKLPAGTGFRFQRDIDEMIEEVQGAIRGVFEGEDYLTRRAVIEDEFNELREKALAELQQEAGKKGLTLLKTPMGVAVGPVREGEVLSPDEFHQLPQPEQERINQAMSELQEKVQAVIRRFPKWEKEGREKLKRLNREMAVFALGHLVDELRERYAALPELVAHLDAVQNDIVENLEKFVRSKSSPSDTPLGKLPTSGPEDWPFARRYTVNLLVDNRDLKGAPVVYEDNPTLANLLGRLEHISALGALITDFGLIRPGALHRANGGYLLLDAERVLRTPLSWGALKRSLRSRQVRIESPVDAFSMVTTVSLAPSPIPLDVKVILMGDPLLYYLLCAMDRDFDQLFKVAADFDDQVDWTDDNDRLYASLIAELARNDGLLPFDRAAVARVIEQGCRLAGDTRKISVHQGRLQDLLREADHFARRREAGEIAATDVQEALDASERRSDRLRVRLQQRILRGVLLIDTEGAAVGRVNGLSVSQLGNFAFGRPCRISAAVRLGSGEVVDIEREVEFGGPVHSKGVLILTGFLGAKFAADFPLSLSATLVFEQSYGEVEGDSASSAELYALLSALAGVGLRQNLAVTGSVNQHGQIQAVGGVNEKIEGFFDICRARGLNGGHGVLIPAANREHLMLREDVRKAVADGLFHVYPVETVDQGLEALTGLPAGRPDPAGVFPEGSVNRRVRDRLREMAGKRAEFLGARGGPS